LLRRFYVSAVSHVNLPRLTIETSAHLLRYDSVHGRFQNEVEIGDGYIDYSNGKVAMSHHRDPGAVDWGGMDVDVVMDCTGIFRSKEGVQPHLKAGAKSVLISAPGTGPIASPPLQKFSWKPSAFAAGS